LGKKGYHIVPGGESPFRGEKGGVGLEGGKTRQRGSQSRSEEAKILESGQGHSNFLTVGEKLGHRRKIQVEGKSLTPSDLRDLAFCRRKKGGTCAEGGRESQLNLAKKKESLLPNLSWE